MTQFKKDGSLRKRPAHLIKKGQVLNPNGRPKGSTNKYSIADLRKAIQHVEKKKHKTFMVAWIESAWGDSTAMSRIAEFMLPKLRSIEGMITTLEGNMSDDMAEEIQEKLRKRFGLKTKVKFKKKIQGRG